MSRWEIKSFDEYDKEMADAGLSVQQSNLLCEYTDRLTPFVTVTEIYQLLFEALFFRSTS